MSEFTDGLRALADFYDARPDFDEPINHRAYVYVPDLTTLARCAKQMGKGDKLTDSKYLTLERKFGSVCLQVYTSHENACERIVIGTRQVERQVPPEGVEMVTVVEDEEIVEWRCPPSILAAGVAAEVAALRASPVSVAS